MSAHQPIQAAAQTAEPVEDYATIAAAAERLAARCEARMPARPWQDATGLQTRARNLRSIAADALAANDGCISSALSVEEWLQGDSELERELSRSHLMVAPR